MTNGEVGYGRLKEPILTGKVSSFKSRVSKVKMSLTAGEFTVICPRKKHIKIFQS